MADPWRLDGRRVVVTGAASGMGAATARVATELGGQVYGLDIAEIDTPVVTSLRCDLSDPASIDETVETVGGPVHVLFCCAGLPNTAPPQQIMEVNFCGHRHLIERIETLMPAGSAIASISSAAGMGWLQHVGPLTELLDTPDFASAAAWCREHPKQVNEGYSFSKEAIVFYAMRRCAGLLGSGIRINATSPGPTDTPMMPAFEQAMGAGYMRDFPKPIGRNSTADEQAYPLVFLGLPAASYVAGHNFLADGGFMAGIMTGQINPASLIPESMK
jgi:NAD(P)-dependent dehydrogenase (short-subunit alcohol dehydrogenase family)